MNGFNQTREKFPIARHFCCWEFVNTRWGKMRTNESRPGGSFYRAATFDLLLTAVVFVVSVSGAVAARHERLIDSWKPLNYNVSLTFDDQLTAITNARTEITILSLKDTLSQIDLDFGDLAIDVVTINKQTAPFERSPGQLNIKLIQTVPRGTRLIVAVSYHGTPKDGLILTDDKAGQP